MSSTFYKNTDAEKNMGLVYMVAKKFTGRGVEFEDIVQIGSIGLVKASNRFNSELGVQFSTYAVSMILGEIRRFFRDDGIIKVSRNIKENAIKIKSATETLKFKNQKEPTIDEISTFTGLSCETIVEALEATVPPESLDFTNKDSGYLLDEVADETKFNEVIEDKIFLKEMLGFLDCRSRQILIMRYFQEKTQQEIADIIGLSQVHISRLEKKALGILRENFSFLQ